jgi:hypothetical protein
LQQRGRDVGGVAVVVDERMVPSSAGAEPVDVRSGLARRLETSRIGLTRLAPRTSDSSASGIAKHCKASAQIAALRRKSVKASPQ